MNDIVDAIVSEIKRKYPEINVKRNEFVGNDYVIESRKIQTADMIVNRGGKYEVKG